MSAVVAEKEEEIRAVQDQLETLRELLERARAEGEERDGVLAEGLSKHVELQERFRLLGEEHERLQEEGRGKDEQKSALEQKIEELSAALQEVQQAASAGGDRGKEIEQEIEVSAVALLLEPGLKSIRCSRAHACWLCLTYQAANARVAAAVEEAEVARESLVRVRFEMEVNLELASSSCLSFFLFGRVMSFDVGTQLTVFLAS